MAENNEKRLTQLESLIMDVLWKLKKASVKDVQDYLKSAKPMAYNTVLTMMRIMRDKGFLTRTREGRTDIYEPRFSQKEIGKNYLDELLNRFFSGSAKALVSQLLNSKKIDQREIKEIRQEIEKKLKRN